MLAIDVELEYSISVFASVTYYTISNARLWHFLSWGFSYATAKLMLLSFSQTGNPIVHFLFIYPFMCNGRSFVYNGRRSIYFPFDARGREAPRVDRRICIGGIFLSCFILFDYLFQALACLFNFRYFAVALHSRSLGCKNGLRNCRVVDFTVATFSAAAIFTDFALVIHSQSPWKM